MKRRFGFTRIDMLMIIMVFSILAVIVIPRVLGIHRKTNEATLRGNLHQLRDAIQQFEADCGDYPAKLSGLTDHEIDVGQKGGRGIELDFKGWGEKAPFIKGELPIDPFSQKTDWVYNPKTGDVHSASTLLAMDGKTKYSEW